MSEYLKTDSIALQHCLLYQFFQKVSIEKSYKEFCKIVGNDVITFEDFKFWFDRFAEGRFDETEEPKNLLEIVQNDKHALRTCVLFEFLKTREELKQGGQRRYPDYENRSICIDTSDEEDEWQYNRIYCRIPDPVFNAYKNLCKVIGDDVIKYQEFDFWYYRFANGLFDLDFEPDPKKKILELGDIPTDVVELFVEQLNYFDRCSVAKVSQNLRHITNSTALTLENVQIDFLDNRTELNFNSSFAPFPIVFSARENGCHVSHLKFETEFPENHLDAALSDIRHFLKNRKLKIQKFRLSFRFENFGFGSDLSGDGIRRQITLGDERHMGNFRKVDEMLKSLDSQLHVECLKMEFGLMEPVMTVLPYLKPGVLEKIKFEGIHSMRGAVEVTGRVIKTEQWKQAKKLKMAVCPTFFHPIVHLLHFNVFSVHHPNLSAKELETLRMYIEVLPDFKSGTILFNDFEHFDFSVMEREFGPPVAANTYRHSIPDSKEYFEIKLMQDQLIIQRIV